MPFVGHDSSTARSFGPGEYAPTEDAYTSAGTPALTVQEKTCCDPSTLVAYSAASSREGWISHARWTTQSAPRKCGTRSSRVMSDCTHSVFGQVACGVRRAIATTDVTVSSRASACSRLVP